MECETDPELVARAMNGGTEAFRKLFESHHAAIFRFAYRIAGTVDVAEDVTQECFIRLVTGRFNPRRGSLRQYLYCIARNVIKQRQCANGREVHWDDDEVDVSPSASALSDVVVSAQTAAAVQSAIALLPYLQREVLVLREFEELSLEVTAAVVGADVGTVKSRLHRARENLRSRLAPYRSKLPEQDKRGIQYGSVK